MASLADAIHRATVYADGLAIDADPAWGQMRTLYGGMTAALCHEAARPLAIAPLRSAQFTFVGPAQDRLEFRAELLRSGKSTQIVAVDCRTREGTAARALLSFGAGRDSAVAIDGPAMPRVAAPGDARRFFGEASPPGFFKNFDIRLARGNPVFSGGDSHFAAWTRFVEPPATDATTALLAMADALPPAAMVAFPQPAVISTLTWSIELFAVPNPDGWVLLESRAEATADGYSAQAMTAWDDHGRCVLSGRQLVAIFA